MNTPEIAPLGDWLDAAPWKDRAVSLLMPDGITGRQATTLAEKRAALTEPVPGPTFVLWTGKWRTDARLLPWEQRGEVADRLV